MYVIITMNSNLKYTQITTKNMKSNKII